MTVTTGIRRSGPPQAVQKVRENSYLVQVPLSESPSADWRRLFYEAQHEPPQDFPPRSVEFTGSALRFRSDAQSIEQKIACIDRWIERANQKEASLGGRSQEQSRRREEWARDQEELAQLNARLSKL